MEVEFKNNCTKQIFTNDTIVLDNHMCFEIPSEIDVPIPPLLHTEFTTAIVYLILLSVTLVTGIFGNIVILVITNSAKGQNKIAKEFMINLALADLCVAGIAEPMCFIGVVKGEAFFSDKIWLCELVAGMCLTSCFCSFMSLTLVSTTRYAYLCHKAVYQKFFGRKTRIGICISTWTCAAILDIGNFVDWGDHIFDKKNHQCIWDRTKMSYLLVALSLIAIPLVVMVICFILTFRHIWKTKKNLHNFNKALSKKTETAMTETLRASTTITIMFIACMICWIPYVVVIFMDMEDKLPFTVHLFVTLVAHMHSSCNFFIQLITNRRFRSVLTKIWCCKTDALLANTPRSSVSVGRTRSYTF